MPRLKPAIVNAPARASSELLDELTQDFLNYVHRELGGPANAVALYQQWLDARGASALEIERLRETIQWESACAKPSFAALREHAGQFTDAMFVLHLE